MGRRSAINPTMAGRIINPIIRMPNPKVSRSSFMARRDACSDSAGRIAVAKATPKMPNGNWINRIP